MKKLLLVLSVAIITIVSCSKKPDPPVPVPPEVLKSITLSKDSLSMFVGDTRQLVFTIAPSDFTVKSLIFTSSDSTTVSVSNIGLLTAKKPGLVVITVANQGNTVSVTCLVTVSPKPIIPPIDSLKLGLIAFYPFSFDSAVDSSGNGNNGTIFDITSVPDRFGKVNSAYYFNGMDSYITVPDKPSLRLSGSDFSLNAWVKLDAYNSSYGSIILAKREMGNNNGYEWGIRGNVDSQVGDLTYGPGSTSSNAFSNSAVGLANWHMVTSVYSLAKQQLVIYIDGVLNSVTNNVLTANPSITNQLYIGKDDPSNIDDGYFLQGTLDDIRIYSRAISVSQIQQLYHSTH